MDQSRDHFKGGGLSFGESCVTGTARPEHGDHGSHDSGTTCRDESSESVAEESDQSEGARLEAQQCLAPPTDTSWPLPAQLVQQQEPASVNYFANFGGTCYPVEAQPSPPLPQPQQEQQQHAAHQSWVALDGMCAGPGVYPASPLYGYVQHQRQELWGSWGYGGSGTGGYPVSGPWGYEGNGTGGYPVSAPQLQQQQQQQQQQVPFDFPYYPENLAGPPCYRANQTEQYNNLQPQACGYGGGYVAGVCPVPIENYGQPQGLVGYGDSFAAGICRAPPMVHRGTTYYG